MLPEISREITIDSIDMNLSKLLEIVKDRKPDML